MWALRGEGRERQYLPVRPGIGESPPGDGAYHPEAAPHAIKITLCGESRICGV